MADRGGSELIEWLMGGDACDRYLTMRNVVGARGEELRPYEAELLSDPRVRSLANSVAVWPWRPLASHKSADHPIHQLVFLSDLGVSAKALDLEAVVENILRSASAEDLPRVPMTISKSHGGSGGLESAWALCDAPLMLYSLSKMRHPDHPVVRRGVEHLVSLARDNGFPCAVSANLGGFRGPGRRDDPCPYATLVMLKLLALYPHLRDGAVVRNASGSLLDLWARSRERHPYMFYMGTDFRKLKAPFIWYDVLHVSDVLSRIPAARGDERFHEMIEIIRSKGDAQGRYTPESAWQAWKEWDFGQKKRPSRGLTRMVTELLSRAGA